MTEFKMTFEDGSTRVLSHHGVKGMKWGVRKERVKTGLKQRWTRDKSQYNPAARKQAVKTGLKSYGKGLAISIGGVTGISLGMSAANAILSRSGNEKLKDAMNSSTAQLVKTQLMAAATGAATAGMLKGAWEYNKAVYGNTGTKSMQRMRNINTRERRR